MFSLAKDIGSFLPDSTNSTSSQICLDVDLASGKSSGETKLRRDPFDTMCRVNILDESYLVAGGGALACNDG
jgi:hypothetical protein